MEQKEIVSKLMSLPDELDKAGQEYAKWKSIFKTIEDQEKVVLSGIKNNIAFNYIPQKVSEAQLEREARGSKEFKQYLFGLSIARKEYLKVEASLNKINIEVDTIRSLNSIRKVEANIL